MRQSEPEATRVHIVIRETLDWADRDAFEAQLPARMVPYVRLWNDTFDLPYNMFRARTKQIAQHNLAAIEGAVVCSWSAVPEGGLVLPVDDDDWFAPSIGWEISKRFDPERFFGYRWPGRFLEVHFNHAHVISAWCQLRLPGLAPKYFCATNNYAFAKGEELRPCWDDHVVASKVFLGRRDRVCQMSDHLSLMNRSLGSTTSFVHGFEAPDPQRLLLRYRQYCRLYRRSPRGALAWAGPYVEQMSSLMASLFD